MSEVVQGPTTLDRARAFVHEHGVRVGAGAAIVAAVVMILEAPSNNQTVWLLVLGPLIVGACVPLASQDPFSNSINGWERHFDRSLSKARDREGKFARYFLRPLHAGSLKLWSLSEPIQNVHIQSGV